MTVEQMALFSQICLGGMIVLLAAAAAMFFLLDIRKAVRIVFGTKYLAASDKKKQGNEKVPKMSTKELLAGQGTPSAEYQGRSGTVKKAALGSGKMGNGTYKRYGPTGVLMSQDDNETSPLTESAGLGTVLLEELSEGSRETTMLAGASGGGETTMLAGASSGQGTTLPAGTALLSEKGRKETMLLGGVQEQDPEGSMSGEPDHDSLEIMMDLTFVHTSVIV